MNTDIRAVEELLLSQIRSEYSEMPGLRLTEAQAARLWNLDPLIARSALRLLVQAGFLTRTENGHYVGTS